MDDLKLVEILKHMNDRRLMFLFGLILFAISSIQSWFNIPLMQAIGAGLMLIYTPLVISEAIQKRLRRPRSPFVPDEMHAERMRRAQEALDRARNQSKRK